MSFKTLASATNTRAVARNTPINQVIPGREADQVKHGGGVVFKLGPWEKLDRFLILGAEGSTLNFAVNPKVTIATNLENVKALLKENGNAVVDRCVEISHAGRARNNDYALLVIAAAMTFGSDHTKRYAASSLPMVARTGTHLLHFANFANGLRGWGKVLKWAIQNWYANKDANQIAYQFLKYQSRDGMSQRDLLRLAHPKAGDDALRNSTYKYMVKGAAGMEAGEMVPPILIAYEQAKTADPKTLIKLITDHRLSQEMIPNEMKNRPDVWEALSQHMGTTALLRNLNKLTSIGLIIPNSTFTSKVIDQLTDVERLKKDRIHPLQAWVARKTYMMGQGKLGSMTWSPVSQISKALEDTFYGSFAAVERTGKNIFLALDVSGSMGSPCMGLDSLTCREAAAIMAMVTARTESNSQIFGFDHHFKDLKIQANDSLDQVIRKVNTGSFGSTNCSLPMQTAQAQRWNIDLFSVYTDNETNQGRNHPSQALQNYRNAMNKPNAKLVSVGLQVNNISIADPKDPGMLDIAGFDSAAPQMISAFAAGQL